MGQSAAEYIVSTLELAGVKRVYGVVGDSLNGFTDAGLKNTREYAGQNDLPKGHWVYVYPYWYIWRDLSNAPKLNRNWGPEQACGEPNTLMAGDTVTVYEKQ